MALKTNAICWNPMEALNFTLASEDHNTYTFDMRNLKISLNVGKGHVSAVLDIDYSPTGKEYVTGSYDKTLRIFKNDGTCREVLHTNRMQRVQCVRFQMDTQNVISGSDDGNIRIWKSKSSEKVGVISIRERNAKEYGESLLDRYKHQPEIKRIEKHRKLPKSIKSAATKKRIMVGAKMVKDENRRKHSKKGKEVVYESERKKHILVVEK
jgi:WD repeat and SOF domain-containing protein 1